MSGVRCKMAEQENNSILLIDDDAHLRLSLRDFLRHRGYAVEVAGSAEEGIVKMGVHVPDLILLDISMPGMGGTGFLKQMAKGVLPTRPVIVLSARTEAKSFFESLEVEAFLPKPCDGNVLLQHIQQCLATRGGAKKTHSRSPLILIAENDAIVSARLKSRLEAQGYTVKLMRTGPEVLEHAPRLHPEAIIIREFLPGMNGSVLAPLLAAMPSTKTAPVVIYDDSGWLKKKHDHFASEFRCVARWVPSIDAEKIVTAVVEVMGGAPV